MAKRGDALRMEINGLKETQAKLTQVARDAVGGPMFRAMRDATLMVLRTSKQQGYVPVDTGRLRASITPDVVMMQGGGIMGIVGSVVTYAPYQEFGTKYMKGKFYLRRAVEHNEDKIMRHLHSVVAKIVAK